MDGLQATAAIRALAGPISNIPIIAMTANALSYQRARYKAAGTSGVVPKPLSPAAPLTALAKLSADDASKTRKPRPAGKNSR